MEQTMKRTSRVRTGAYKSDAIRPLEEKNNTLSYQIALESIVLLKNDGTLPIAKGKIALYGNGVKYTSKGGTGSGEVNERHAVSFYEGMENAGYEITSQRWLADYEEEYQNGLKEYERHVQKLISESIRHLNLAKFNEAFGLNYEHPYGRSVNEQDVIDSNTNNCVYVVSRQCGEGMDRDPDSFMNRLTEKELEDIRFLAKHYAQMVVVLNVGVSMEVHCLDDIEGISAILYMGMLGCRGGDAIADIIAGNATPCGHLSETWVEKYDDIPFGRSFGKMSPDVLQQDYKEGIYVGYRYFDTFQKKVQYSFGYGLSYTSFQLKAIGMQVDGLRIRLDVTVRNIGKKYSGKETIQVYLAAPEGKFDKPKKQLAGFAKTRLLLPDETEDIQVVMDLKEQGVYDELRKMTIIEAGEYEVLLGDSSDSTQAVGTIHVPREVVLSKHRGLDMQPVTFQELKAPGSRENDSPERLAVTIEAADHITEIYGYTQSNKQTQSDIEEILAQLTISECIDLVVGDGMDILGKPHDFICPGAVGYTTSTLVSKGVPLLIMSDGPAGLRIQKVNALGKNKIRPVEAMGNVFNYLPRWLFRMIHANPNKSELLYQFATSFPVGNMVAQTWNVELMEQEGEAISDEMNQYGIHYWLGPAMNIHRNPMNGRNYEYYSEDPYLTGKVAAAVTRGVQKRNNTAVTLKHFCCNNQEESRGMMSSNVSERAMREIYLRPFEIAVRDSEPRGIMTSYNRCNQVYNNNNPKLLEDVLRCEWGYQGLVMTDWMATSKGAADPALALKAGNDLLMPGMKSDKKRIRQALKKREITEDDIRKCARNIIRMTRMNQI